MAEAACVRCGGEAQAGATRCRHCGYDTTAHNRYRWLWGLLSLPFMLSLIGIPLGLIFLKKARSHKNAYERGVAE